MVTKSGNFIFYLYCPVIFIENSMHSVFYYLHSVVLIFTRRGRKSATTNDFLSPDAKESGEEQDYFKRYLNAHHNPPNVRPLY